VLRASGGVEPLVAMLASWGRKRPKKGRFDPSGGAVLRAWGRFWRMWRCSQVDIKCGIDQRCAGECFRRPMNRPNARKEVRIEQNQSDEKSRKDPRALTGAETSCRSLCQSRKGAVEKTPEPSRALKRAPPTTGPAIGGLKRLRRSLRSDDNA
jgi:hypothetical protein